MSSEISNSDDVIDSRDIIERIAELEARDNDDPHDALTGDEKDELAALKALADDAEGCGDWKYGETLIRDSYFQAYAEELADDIGAINSDATWPNNCIDWERAARELQMDYMSVEFDGVTYWLRS